jgi:hypothetical protein
MILYYDNEGKITATSTWTLANPATYLADGYLMIAGVGQRPLPADAFCFDFQPDTSEAMAAMALEIEAEKERFTVVDGALLKDGEAVALDFVPGVGATAKVGMASDPTILAFFDMTDEQLGGYVVTNFGYTAQQAGAFVVLRDVIRGLARAAGVARR